MSNTVKRIITYVVIALVITGIVIFMVNLFSKSPTAESEFLNDLYAGKISKVYVGSFSAEVLTKNEKTKIAEKFPDKSSYTINVSNRAELVIKLERFNMGLDPTVITPFTDSHSIAYWAIREVEVARVLGLIHPDENGNIHPNRMISKAEAAALFNELVEFMRVGLVSEFSEQIVNIPR